MYARKDGGVLPFLLHKPLTKLPLARQLCWWRGGVFIALTCFRYPGMRKGDNCPAARADQ
jgi:hypothetical protein